jgi:hypothetical protein
MLISSVAAQAATFSPLFPNPSRPAGREGGLTTEFGYITPTTWLRPQGCHRCFARRFFAYGRSDCDAIARANGGRAAARSGCTNLRPFTTTAGSPTQAPTSETQRHPSSSAFGAKKPNVVFSPPLARRGERGWGRVGETKATKSNKPDEQRPLSKGENK